MLKVLCWSSCNPHPLDSSMPYCRLQKPPVAAAERGWCRVCTLANNQWQLGNLQCRIQDTPFYVAILSNGCQGVVMVSIIQQPLSLSSQSLISVLTASRAGFTISAFSFLFSQTVPCQSHLLFPSSAVLSCRIPKQLFSLDTVSLSQLLCQT